MKDTPPVGQCVTLEPGVRRILAPNPSPMTFWGTNTYLVGTGDVALIDPGPDSAAHRQAIKAALAPGERVSHILVTHSHLDHSPLAAALGAEFDTPVLGFGPWDAGMSTRMRQLAAAGGLEGGEGVDRAFRPDRELRDGDTVAADTWQLEALWTPGHMSNHMCFAFGDRLFTGDLVMGWASSLVSPPDGDLTAFMASCRRLQSRHARIYHPGHGAPVATPQERLHWLITHRETRERQILAALAPGPATAAALTGIIYTDTPAHLHPMARRNILAHLIDLQSRNMVDCNEPLTPDSVFALI
ncbi:MBL fold metallo-hydrolase [Brevirhabdus sp.]|uniref:MBL fold metallo-hydrolase n=1 Tax=Brevirhabdus sp. TaxID=2004514 RepID=UPI004059FE55